MKELIEMLALAAKRHETLSHLGKLTAEQRAEYYMRIDHAHNEAVHWKSDLDEQGLMLKALYDGLVTIAESDHIRQHYMIDENLAVHQESLLRNDFYRRANKMWNTLVSYAEYLGYCTNDGIKAEREAIDKEFGIVTDSKES